MKGKINMELKANENKKLEIGVEGKNIIDMQ